MTMTRMKNRKILRLLPLMLAVLLLGVFWLSGVGRNEYVWPDLVKNGMSGFREGDKTFSLSRGDTYGLLNEGPYFSLPAGTYTLECAIETDAENVIRIETGNGARVQPAQITIPANVWSLKESFTLLDDAENLQIRVGFENGTYLKLHSVKMSTLCTDGLWLLTAAVIALGVLYLMNVTGYLTAERKKILLILGLAVLLVSVPALRENLNAGHDSEFHRMRLRSTANALAEGQFPVRVGGSMYNGYGSATSVFYPDAAFYLPALLMIGGATIQFAMSAFIVLTNAVTAACMYACGKRIFASWQAGTCAAVLYLTAAYRLTDIYVRMAAGEVAAMAVLPLFVLGLWEVVFGEKRCWLLLALSATAVFMTHIITTVLCAVMAAAVGVCCLGRIIREGRLVPILKAIGLTVLLNVYYLVPMLHYMMRGVSMGALNSSVAAGAMEPMYLLASDPAFPRDIGAALLVGAAATLYMFMGSCDAQMKLVKRLIALGAVLALMTTNLFPWAQLESRLGMAVNFLQFPWRLLMFVDVLLALAVGCGAVRMAEKLNVKTASVPLVLAACVFGCYGQLAQYTVTDNAPLRYWLSNSQMITAYAEYTLEGSDLARTVTEPGVRTSGDVQFSGYEKRGTQASLQVSAQEGGTLALPVFGFDGYRAELDGQETAWTLGDNNRLTVEIPAGTDAQLRVWYAGKVSFRIADAVSLSALAFAFWLILRRKGETVQHQET